MPSTLARRQITSHLLRLEASRKKASSNRSGMPEPSRTRTFAPEDEASMTTHSRSARPLMTSQAVAAGDVRSGRFAMKGKDGIRSRPSEPLSLLHRVIDRESVCPIGLLGDHGIRAAGHEGRDRAIV